LSGKYQKLDFWSRGAYGHPDHIAIPQLRMAGIVCTADPIYESRQPFAAHRVSKLYDMT